MNYPERSIAPYLASSHDEDEAHCPEIVPTWFIRKCRQLDSKWTPPTQHDSLEFLDWLLSQTEELRSLFQVNVEFAYPKASTETYIISTETLTTVHLRRSATSRQTSMLVEYGFAYVDCIKCNGAPSVNFELLASSKIVIFQLSRFY